MPPWHKCQTVNRTHTTDSDSEPHKSRYGVAPAVRVPGGFLACTHEVSPDTALGRTYLHRFVLVDDAFSLAAASEPFFLAERGIEFAAGLLAGEDRDELLLAFGVRDASAFVVRLSLGAVLGSLRELGGA